MSGNVSPTRFPWQSLERIQRSSLPLLWSLSANFSRTLPAHRIEQAESFLGELFKTQASLQLVSIPSPRLPHPSLLPNGATILLEAGPTHPLAVKALVALEAALAHSLVTNLLSTPYLWPHPSRPAPQPVHEACAAFVLAVGRHLGLVPDFQLRGAGPRAWSEFHDTCQSAPHRVVALDGKVRLDHKTYAWSVYLLLHERPTSADIPLDLGALRGLGAIPLSLSLVGASTWTSRQLLQHLEPGGAWLPGDGWTVQVQPEGLSGEVWLQSPGSSWGIRSKLRLDGSIALGEEVSLMQDSRSSPHSSSSSAPQPVAAPTPSGDGAAATSIPAAIPRAVADVPVLVRVELGTVSLTAQQWAQVAPGTILTTGHPVGQQVVLRVGDVEVAHGELVNVEGELGVRIHSLTRHAEEIR